MKILVIGSNSFSGSSFINFILNKKYKVVGLSRSNEYDKVFLRYKDNVNIKNFQFYKIDINKQYKKLFEIINKVKPSFIVNFAAQGMVNESWEKPIDWYHTNFLSQVRLLEFLKNKKYLKKYIHFTTPEVYGNISKWKKECFEFNPSTPYALSRAATDLHLNNLFKTYKFPVIFTRAANVYGEGQQLYRIITKSILSFKLRKRINLHGGGHSVRSFIHIDDVSNAIYKILKNGKLGNTYHISTNKIVSIKNLLNVIAKIMDVDIKNLVKITDDRLGKDYSYKLNSSKIRKELKWNDAISLNRGIKKTILWVENNIETLKKQPREYTHKS